jgi:hypothetical protein
VDGVRRGFERREKEQDMSSIDYAAGGVEARGTLAEVRGTAKATRLVVELDPSVAALVAGRLVPLVGAEVSVGVAPVQARIDVDGGDGR